MILFVTFRPPYDEGLMPDPVLVISEYQLDDIGHDRWRQLQAEEAQRVDCEAHELRTLGVQVDGDVVAGLFNAPPQVVDGEVVQP